MNSGAVVNFRSVKVEDILRLRQRIEQPLRRELAFVINITNRHFVYSGTSVNSSSFNPVYTPSPR